MSTITRFLLKTGAAAAVAGVLLLSGAVNASAQGPHVGAGFVVGVPTGEFADTLDRVGFGVGIEAGYHLGVAPIEFGLQGSFMTYGSESRKEPWSTTIPDVRVDVETSNNIALGHIYARLIPASGIIRPYVDGKVGFSYLYTSTSVKSEGTSENNEIASSTNFDDGVFSYGGSAGTLIRIHSNDRRPGSEGDVSEVLLDARVGYIAGGEAEYLTTGSIKREGSNVSYSPKRSRTDMITAHLGVQVRF